MINEKPAGFLTKAERSLEATGLLLNAGHADFAVSRLYYAFYTPPLDCSRIAAWSSRGITR